MLDTSTHVILVRHGRTALNAEGRLRGLADPDLDEIGIEEARATANALLSLGITRVLSSPLHRAARTAKIIAEFNGVGHSIDPMFNDRDYGPWTGRVKAEVIDQWGSIDEAPGVESESVVLARVLRALTTLAQGERGPIAVVTHDAVIRPVLTNIRPEINVEVATGSWADLMYTSDGWTIVSVDNTASKTAGDGSPT